ncbi:hypothetical protein C7B67_16490 [filamentous cyanobacterium Phorm 6]|nr:hypothetical protein C7B67_16490 [filamentous cyanobacterium Phorm 6]
MSEENNKKGKSRDGRDRLTFDVGGLRDRLRVFAIEPNQSLASIVRMALLEWLAVRESRNYEKSPETDKNDISINDND